MYYPCFTCFDLRSDVLWIDGGRESVFRRDAGGATSLVGTLPDHRPQAGDNLAVSASERLLYWLSKTDSAVYLERIDLQSLGEFSMDNLNHVLSFHIGYIGMHSTWCITKAKGAKGKLHHAWANWRWY